MLHIRNLTLGLATFAGLVLPLTASANTKCLCNNGMITQSMSDDADACDDACDEFGGGRVWTPEDAGFEGGSSASESEREERIDQRQERREQPPAGRR